MTSYSAVLLSPAGALRIVVDGAGRVRAIGFPGREPLFRDAVEDEERCGHVVRQLREYFAGERREFELELDPSGTAFQRRVWNALRAIPYGETRSYQDLARAIGSSSAVRAVGAANARNPIPIVVPCHRVIGKDGSLTGFGGGLEVKRMLLELERGVVGRGRGPGIVAPLSSEDAP